MLRLRHADSTISNSPAGSINTSTLGAQHLKGNPDGVNSSARLGKGQPTFIKIPIQNQTSIPVDPFLVP